MILQMVTKSERTQTETGLEIDIWAKAMAEDDDDA